MIQTAADMFARVGPIAICIVFGIMMLMLFGRFLNYLDSRKIPVGVIRLKGVLDEDLPIDVHLQDGEILRRVKIRQADFKDYPTTFSFQSMIVFQLEQGGFSMVREDWVRKIDFPNCKDIVMSIDQGRTCETLLSNE